MVRLHCKHVANSFLRMKTKRTDYWIIISIFWSSWQYLEEDMPIAYDFELSGIMAYYNILQDWNRYVVHMCAYRVAYYT